MTSQSTPTTPTTAGSPASAAPLRGKRILIAKPGLDGHDIGAKVIALTLRDAGAEVIYTGLRKRPADIARVAIDEGVDAVGLSILSGSHRELVAQVVDALRRLDAADIRVFVGGTIPADDHAALVALGVRGIYTSEQPLDEVVASLARELA
jgi:methylmalonyl-CoA mutase C-terminal domain/subunit